GAGGVVMRCGGLGRCGGGEEGARGKRLVIDMGEPWRCEIIGVARDSKQFSLDMDVFPAMYLPSIRAGVAGVVVRTSGDPMALAAAVRGAVREVRSEEHTSELQSLTNLVCRLLLEKRKCSPNPPIRSGVPPAIPL